MPESSLELDNFKLGELQSKACFVGVRDFTF